MTDTVADAAKEFTLVTTCRNERVSLDTWKQNVLDQTRQPNEIVIVDAFSDDGTYEALVDWSNEDSRLRVIQESGAAARGRNVAISAASHDLILSTDMGVRLAPVWCEELIKPFEKDPSLDVVMGNSIIDRESVQSAAARAEWYLQDGGEVLRAKDAVPNNRSVAYFKRVWIDLGGLPEDLTFYADDSVFGRQIVNAGYRVACAPKAMTYWSRPSGLKAFWREQYVYAFGDGEAAIKMPYAVKLSLNGSLPPFLAKLLNGLRNTQKSMSTVALVSAIRRGDFLALIVFPILLFGNGWIRASGYMHGYERGCKHCQTTRRRMHHEY
jgi:cellulose synthase/poly-beta-1,6-N-acetylglucosamine synthase-like glycosyltransferase